MLNSLLSIFFILLFLIGVIFLPILLWRRIQAERKDEQKIQWLKQLRFVVMRILVPRNNEKTPLAAEQMFAALHGIYNPNNPYQEYISLEIASRDKYMEFYITIPSHLKDFAQGQIYAQYPTAEICEVDDYTLDQSERIKNGEIKICGTELSLINNEVYPIKTFLNFEVDPLSSITSVMSKIEKDEQLWIQVLIKPVSDDWQKKGITHIKQIKGGEAGPGIGAMMSQAILHALGGVISTILTGATPPSQKVEEIKGKYMPVNIHGKTYITVAERIQQAHRSLKELSIMTEVLYQEPVVVKATVRTPKGTYTGISAANPQKMIEKISPYEVAESSAVGRALGFAGFSVSDGVASAEEITKANDDTNEPF